VYTDEIRSDVAAMGLGNLPITELDDPAAPDALVRAVR